MVQVLSEAKEKGKPYHIVHFDGHGVYAELSVRPGKHGYLSFENPNYENNVEHVDGRTLGRLLVDNGVPVLVLNACQSAYAETVAQPHKGPASDTRQEVSAYGSLAQEVINIGGVGVVAMRYSIHVITAAQFVAELYMALAQGRTLGESVNRARKNLFDHPERQVSHEPRPLQDWVVPIVYEQAVLRLWPEQQDLSQPITVCSDGIAKGYLATDRNLPASPEFGFHGRDKTLYEIDRAFDEHSVVLLQAYAGSGKTATAVEFAQWYVQTGGLDGPILFSSFERHLPLCKVLDKIGETFGDNFKVPNQVGELVEWGSLVDHVARCWAALKILEQVPVFWIWDNIDQVSGFPKGTSSHWSIGEQQELVEFLLAARNTRAKFLLTSRREEHDWLGDLPERIKIPTRMPMRERLQFAIAIAQRYGKPPKSLPDLRPLLKFTQGNPLTVLVTVNQALRAGFDTAEKLTAYIEKLRTGEVIFDDEFVDRSCSLDVSLSYGFKYAFTEKERKVLSLLYLFQCYIKPYSFQFFSFPDCDWCLDSVRGLTREQCITLLNRASEIGLLTNLGKDLYKVHPALPWFLRPLFVRYYPPNTEEETRARRGFAEGMGELGRACLNSYNHGDRQYRKVLANQERNLLSAWLIARAYSWSRAVIGIMQGLRVLYGWTGQHEVWQQLVEAVVPEFVDIETDGPKLGHEEDWSLVTEYRARLAIDNREWELAKRLLCLIIDWHKQHVKTRTGDTPESTLRSLMCALRDLGSVQCEQRDIASIESFREAFEISNQLEEYTAKAALASDLGNAYILSRELIVEDETGIWYCQGSRDLTKALEWYKKSYILTPPDDKYSRTVAMHGLARVWEHMAIDCVRAHRPIEETKEYLCNAKSTYLELLNLADEEEYEHLAAAHESLGRIFCMTSELNKGMLHYRKAIRYRDILGDTYKSAELRQHMATLLAQIHQFANAHEFASSALAGFQKIGKQATKEVADTQTCLAEIDQEIQQKGD